MCCVRKDMSVLCEEVYVCVVCEEVYVCMWESKKVNS